MFDKYIAQRYGITERLEALEKALLSVKGVTEVSLDINGYLDDIYEVIVIAKYVDGCSAMDIVNKAKEQRLIRTLDRIENYGEHFYIVFSSARWNDNREYALFYDHKGHDIPVGSEGWVPNRTIVNKLLKYHEDRPLLKDNEIFIRERQKQKLYEPMKRFNGQYVYNEDYCYWNALSVGDYVCEGIYDYMVNCMSPACWRADCTQFGEPNGIRIDDNGVERSVYLTIKKVSDGIWQFCGRCFKGENVERGSVPSYV